MVKNFGNLIINLFICWNRLKNYFLSQLLDLPILLAHLNMVIEWLPSQVVTRDFQSSCSVSWFLKYRIFISNKELLLPQNVLSNCLPANFYQKPFERNFISGECFEKQIACLSNSFIFNPWIMPYYKKAVYLDHIFLASGKMFSSLYFDIITLAHTNGCPKICFMKWLLQLLNNAIKMSPTT